MANGALENDSGRKSAPWWSTSMAVLSFLLGSILTTWAGYVVYFMLHTRTGGDWGGMGATISRVGAFITLALATSIGGPLAFLLGLGAAIDLKKDPVAQKKSKILARLGMFLSALVSASVALGYVMLSL